MCGIAGFHGGGTKDELSRMIARLAHRGPDDRGVYAEGGVGLAQARLAVIDLSPAGHQPMWNADHSVGITYNGEIYNFLALKEEFLADRKFVSASDTEVIIGLYERFGEACFAKLEGMFAIALYDAKQDRLILARDRMGKKPLYWGEFGGSLVFASEPKAIWEHRLSKKEIDVVALDAYLALDYVPAPLSIWKGVMKLPPGHFLIREKGSHAIRTFWTPDTRERALSLDEATKELDRTLSRAVSERLIADVPLGVFLSGGLDSSSVAYYAARAKKDPIHTFSIGFSEASFDESAYAKEVALHLGTIHHHRLFSASDSLDLLPDIFAKLDEPMADASILPTHLLSRFTKEQVTVALGGDGGDELFAGYPTFLAERYVGSFQRLPSALRALLVNTARVLPVSQENFGLRFKLEKFAEGANERSLPRRHGKWLGSFDETERRRLYSDEVARQLEGVSGYESLERVFSNAAMSDVRNRMLFMYQRGYMMDEVMVKVDRASMYAALETRAPFLDREVVEFANRLPYAMKLHGTTSKYVLKKTMEGKLPQHIIDRQKKGFGVPVGAWLRNELKAWGASLLVEPSELLGGMISSSYAKRLWEEHQRGERDNRKKLWNLLVLMEWEKNFDS